MKSIEGIGHWVQELSVQDVPQGQGDPTQSSQMKINGKEAFDGNTMKYLRGRPEMRDGARIAMAAKTVRGEGFAARGVEEVDRGLYRIRRACREQMRMRKEGE